MKTSPSVPLPISVPVLLAASAITIVIFALFIEAQTPDKGKSKDKTPGQVSGNPSPGSKPQSVSPTAGSASTPVIKVPSTVSTVGTQTSGQTSRELTVEIIPNRNSNGKPQSISEWPSEDKRWALVIGVDKYNPGENISELPGADKDAKELSQALHDYSRLPTSNIITMTTDAVDSKKPTKGNILRQLANLKDLVPEDGMLVFFFAGHGIIDSIGQTYLIPADGSVTPAILKDQSIPVTRVTELIREIGVKQVVLLLDACRNDPRTGGRGDGVNNLSNDFVGELRRAMDEQNSKIQAFVTIYATSLNERAWEYREKDHGYFTWALIEGLKGEAKNQSGDVTLGSLIHYLQAVVPKLVQRDLGKKQTPRLELSEGVQYESLVIAKLAPAVTTTSLMVMTNPNASLIVSDEKGKTLADVVADNNGLSDMAGLPIGKCRVTAQAAGFLSKSEEVVLSLKKNSLPLMLTPVPKPPFKGEWKKDGWQVTGGANWRFDGDKCMVRGAGLAIPNGDEYRYYDNFILQTQIKLVQDRSASFVLRYVNEENYYLVQLNSKEISLAVVKKGVHGPPQTIPIAYVFEKDVSPTDFFEFKLKMNEYTVNFSIDVRDVGGATDHYGNFKYGAIGIKAGDNGAFDINEFRIATGKDVK